MQWMSPSSGKLVLRISHAEGRTGWFHAVSTWYPLGNKTLDKNLYDSKALLDVVALLTDSTGGFVKFVDNWPNHPEIKFIDFVMSSPNLYNLEVVTEMGAGASSQEFLLFSLAPLVVGVDDSGKPTTRTLKASVDVGQTAAVGNNREIPGIGVVTEATEAQTATLIKDASTELRAVGGNVAAALDRLRALAAKAALGGAVGRTQAALADLVSAAPPLARRA